ncbi:MAG: cation diffusion facilitator family transporter [Solirubrobacteraceae bacterium]
MSIASNAALIALKIAAAAITGSVAIASEAIHSAIDLIASIVAFVSVRKADEPADDTHHYGHQKAENLAAAIEGMLILVGSGVIVYEAVSRLVSGAQVASVGVGIAVIAFSLAVNLGVGAFVRRRARQTDSAALEGDAAHIASDAVTSAGVLAGLVLVKLTGADWIDSAVALVVAVWIVASGLRILTRSSRVLLDETLPADELDAIRREVVAFGDRGVAGFHQLRARRAGAHRYVDLHVQFRAGTTLEDAHRTAHELQDAIRGQLGGADVLIHLEPEDRVRPGTEIPPAPGPERPPVSAG